MNLHDVNRGIHKHKKKKRVGRGTGCGHGKTSGRGHKGQGAVGRLVGARDLRGRCFALDSPHSQARFPQRLGPRSWPSVNVGDLDAAFKAGEEVTLETLCGQGSGQGPLRRVEDPGRRRADQEAQDLGPSLQPVGAGEDRKGRRRGDRAAGQEARGQGSSKKAAESSAQGQEVVARPVTSRQFARSTSRQSTRLRSRTEGDNARPRPRRRRRELPRKDGSSHVGKTPRRLHDSRTAEEDPLHARAVGRVSRGLADSAADHRSGAR